MSSISTSFIRASAPAEIAQHLRDVRTVSSDEEITQNLLQSIGCGSILPSTYAIWLGVSQSSSAVREALKQQFSIQIRQSGIKRLSKVFKSAKWANLWDTLGGTNGLMGLFSDFSVHEIHNVCFSISTSTKGPDLETKRIKVTELLKALLHPLFPDTPYRTPDSRPLFRLYQRLVPGCTPEFVGDILNQKVEGEWTHFHNHFLFRSHTDTLRDLSLQTIFKERTNGRQWLLSLTGKHPSAAGTYPKFSASMQFAFEVLRRLVKEESSTLSDDDFLEGLVEPLAKRAIRRKIDWNYTQEIFDLTVCYLNRRPGAAKKLVLYYGRLLHVAAICWTRRSEMFESSVSALLLIWFKEQPRREVRISAFQDIMTGLPRTRCYDFLKFCYKTLTGRDIDNVEDLKTIEGVLSSDLLDRFTPEHALVFFTRLRSARGDKDLVARGQFGYSVRGITSSPKESMGDPDMMQITLIHRYSDAQKSEHQIENTKQLAAKAEQIAARRIQEGKKKAMSSPDQPDRAFYAVSVLYFSIASRSLQLYRETLEWARRFVRDPLTATEIYRAYPIEVKSLLCGIPVSLRRDDTSSAIRTYVEEGNRILLGLFETVCSALREPSFDVRNWEGTFLLFEAVANERMRRSAELKTSLDISDDEVYSIIWEDTLAMIIKLEEEALKPSHERLESNGLHGVLNYARNEAEELKDAEPSTYLFLDNLAKARDQLWRKFRPTVHPSAAALPESFPRGLPIQYLTGRWLIRNPSLTSYTPYLAGRANAAVYMSTAVALTPIPTNRETPAAIGQFIDDYRFALRMLVPSSDEDEAKKQVEQAHAYLIGPLSKPRMSYEEAMRYCRVEDKDDLIRKFWPDIPGVNTDIRPWSVVFPEVDDANEIEEWDPVPPEKAELRPRKLDPTYLDYSMSRLWNFSEKVTIRSAFKTFEPVIVGQAYEHDFRHLWLSWRAADEGEILAALLFIDSRNSATSRLLISAFPSPEDVRYPAVYLDEQLLSKAQLRQRQDAIEYLERHVKVVPPILLAQAANNTLNALDIANPSDPEFINLERDTFLLINALSKSDRPGFASELIVKTIIQRPEASSWHRRLLSNTYLRRLPASDAQACFQTFAELVIAKLEEQAKAKIERLKALEKAVKPAEDTPHQPFVKVTTVKFLAQLLHNSEIVSKDFSFSVLSTLFEEASHMDIRRAVVGGLLNMLQTSTADLSERIFTMLETIVSIAGNLDERHPITDSDWMATKESLELPELEASLNTSPMLNALFSFYGQGHTDVKHGETFMTRIILPIIKSLQQETAHWTSLFLLKHGIDLETQKELNIPTIPKSPEIWTRFLHLKSSYLPLSYLEEYVDHSIFNIAPLIPIKALNKKFTEDSVLHSDPAVGYWLLLYGTNTNINPQFPLASLLSQPSDLLEEVSISTKQVQELFLKQFTVLLWNDAPQYTELHRLISRELRPTRFDQAWLTGQKPIVEAIVMYIEGLRTRDWERDPDRQPSVLPQTFFLRLWLLKYPQSHVGEYTDLPLSTEQEAACKAFAGQLASTVDQICGRLYHAKLELVKDAVRSYVSGMHRVVVGCWLGNIEKTKLSWLTRPDELRVELAAFMLEGMVVKDEGVKKRVGGVLESWRRSESEEVRRLGLVTLCR